MHTNISLLSFILKKNEKKSQPTTLKNVVFCCFLLVFKGKPFKNKGKRFFMPIMLFIVLHSPVQHIHDSTVFSELPKSLLQCVATLGNSWYTFWSWKIGLLTLLTNVPYLTTLSWDDMAMRKQKVSVLESKQTNIPEILIEQKLKDGSPLMS